MVESVDVFSPVLFLLSVYTVIDVCIECLNLCDSLVGFWVGCVSEVVTLPNEVFNVG